MPTHRSEIATWMSRARQSAYGTVVSSSGPWRRVVANEQNIIDLDTAFEDNAAYETGSDVADDMWAITNDSGLTVPFDFCFQDIGFWLDSALGTYAVTGPISAQYTHTFTPQNVLTSRQLPVRTFAKRYGGLKILVMRDGVVTMLTISGGKTGRIKCSATVKGSGHYAEDPAGYTLPALESDREWGYNQKAQFSFTDGTNSQVYTCDIEDWTFTIENPESDPGYRACSPFLVTNTPASGAIRSEYLVGVRRYSMAFNCRFSTGDRMRGWMKAGTNLSMSIVVNGAGTPTHSLTIAYTKMRVIRAKESIVGDYVGISGEVQGLSSSGSIPLTCTLLNDITSHIA